MIRAIAALDDRRGIGKEGRTPWHIPEELQYFRDQTEGHIILMGRQTYELFETPLVNRRNIVVSRSLDAVRLGFELTDDPTALLKAATEDIWIIGGAEIFATFLQFCDELYLTHVTGDYKCDRFFPDYEEQFKLVKQTAQQTSGPYSFRYAVYNRT